MKRGNTILQGDSIERRRKAGMCEICVECGRNSLKFSADLRQESWGLPPVLHIHPPVTPLDMPQSLCGLDHAGTGKEGSSAKRKRDNRTFEQSLGNDTCEDGRRETDKIAPDGGESEKMWWLSHESDVGWADTHPDFALDLPQCESEGVMSLISEGKSITDLSSRSTFPQDSSAEVEAPPSAHLSSMQLTSLLREECCNA